MFNTILEAPWLRKQRFEHGLTTLLTDAASDDELEAVQHVLKNLSYHTSADLVAAADEAAAQILSGWCLEPRDTLVVGVAERSKTCGSGAYLRAIELALPREWGAHNAFWTPFDSAFRQSHGREHLVIVDDFIGTGEKITNKVAALKANPKTRSYNIYVCCFAAMSKGAAKVDGLVNGDLLVHHYFDRCISDKTVDPKKASLAAGMGSLEGKIFNHPGKYSFGYMQSEAAFYLEGFNIPNNNFPILWVDEYADKKPRAPLFARR
ncbi:hypothetical protein [Paucibacter sp. DJ2R-2]|uniref:phosphoribosyltransferase-like protein n=1 Tax=Paucibacter sp. DJ2R-2 TaxID=2893558 RepID=UPI0021E3E6AB|nr:hypothetical protein [Paucibacter sp. DJ2R-2]MCV2421339.1 hypothetical protein [Paucibacter sp. DJ4R-1]MCV2441206.1 hypothetical protein [Paucibacter sp. DJ2R-2]